MTRRLTQLVIIVCLLLVASQAEALNVSLPKTWVTGDVLTASDLNNEFTTLSTRSIDSTDMATTITWGATGNQYLDMSAITSSTTKGLRLPVGTGGTNAGQVSYDATSLWLRIGSGSVANFLPIIAAQGSAGQVLMSQGANTLASWVSSLAATSPSFTLTPTGGVAAGMHSELFGSSATDFYLKNGTRWILEEWPNALVIGGNSAAASATQIVLKTTTTGDTALVLPANSVSLQGEVTGTLPVANGGTGATTLTSNGLLLGGGTGAITASSALTNGQLLIGSTGVAPVAATITAGASITVTNAAGSITIASTAAGVSVYGNVFTRDTTIASGTQAITGVGFRPKGCTFNAVQPATREMSIGSTHSTTASLQVYIRDDSPAADTYQVSNGQVIFDDESAGVNYAGVLQSFDADGFTISWTKTGAPTGILNVNYYCQG